MWLIIIFLFSHNIASGISTLIEKQSKRERKYTNMLAPYSVSWELNGIHHWKPSTATTNPTHTREKNANATTIQLNDASFDWSYDKNIVLRINAYIGCTLNRIQIAYSHWKLQRKCCSWPQNSIAWCLCVVLCYIVRPWPSHMNGIH